MGGRGSTANRNSGGFVYERSADIKAWSSAEEKRSQETSEMINKYYHNEDIYEEVYGDEVFSQELGPEYGFREGTEANIHKNHWTYVHGWDENDNYVKRGAKVKGSTYYSVGVDGDILNENVLGYKTLADAKHALALELDYYKQRESYYRRRK